MIAPALLDRAMNLSSARSILPALLAAALPLLLAPSVSPTTTFVNQWVAFAGGCVWLGWAVAGRDEPGAPAQPMPLSLRMLVGVLLALAAAQLLTVAPLGQRWVPMASLLLAAALAAAAGRQAARGSLSSHWQPLMVALVVAGGLSTVVAAVQMAAPQWADGLWVAYPGALGRPIGNMRQPNQLSTLLIWSCAAAVWLTVRRGGSVALLGALLALLVLAVAGTASRTGTLGVLLLALWGAIDRRLPGRVRLLMLASLPFYALGWWGMEAWAQHAGTAFYGEDQLRKTLHGDASSSRGRIWGNTLALITAHPWTGVGPGAFNFAWSMSVFPDRPVAFFDHSHNLVLQLAVESGVPLALAVLSGLGLCLWRARGALTDADDARALSARTAAFMLALVGAHSLLEYPLWYLYFLLPAAVMAGTLAGMARSPDATPPTRAPALAATPPPAVRGLRPEGPRWRRALAVLGLVGALTALFQYYTVAVIFEPDLALGEPAPLADRIRTGQRSTLFGHHADYAAVTMAPRPELVFDAFRRPLHHLLDTRLMTAYARALAARGDTVRARHMAARLREFNNPQAAEFFAVCQAAQDVPVSAQPFQCQPDPRLAAEALRP
jgi:O-antigen ligase